MSRHPEVEVTCIVCGTKEFVRYKHRERRFCNRMCYKVWASTNNPARGKVYRSKATHPEWAENISKGLIRNEVNVGDKNGMKQPDARAKQSKTRKEKFANDPIFREQHAQQRRQAWLDGKYDNVPVGKCKWYAHTKPSGEIVKLQGTWEVAVARYFDANNIDYVAHRGRFPYTTPDGATRSYYPDFFLPSTNEHVDVKGAFWSWEQRDKLDHIRNSNPTMKLVIYDKKKLEDLNIDYGSVQKELL